LPSKDLKKIYRAILERKYKNYCPVEYVNMVVESVRNEVREYPQKHILEIHDHGYLNYFKRVCAGLKPGKSVYPYVFPIRNATRPPKELSVRAGYY